MERFVAMLEMCCGEAGAVMTRMAMQRAVGRTSAEMESPLLNAAPPRPTQMKLFDPPAETWPHGAGDGDGRACHGNGNGFQRMAASVCSVGAMDILSVARRRRPGMCVCSFRENMP